MDQIETDVKNIIIDVSGLHGTPDQLHDATTLAQLNFNDTMCLSLAQRLDAYVKKQNPNGTIDTGDISTDKASGDIVQLVKDQISG